MAQRVNLFLTLLAFENISSSGCGNVGKSGRFFAGLSKRLREATPFVAFRERGISTGGLAARRFHALVYARWSY